MQILEATFGSMKQVRDPLAFPLVSRLWFDKVMTETEVETNLSQVGVQAGAQAGVGANYFSNSRNLRDKVPGFSSQEKGAGEAVR